MTRVGWCAAEFMLFGSVSAWNASGEGANAEGIDGPTHSGGSLRPWIA
jgi:hypothetical protein